MNTFQDQILFNIISLQQSYRKATSLKGSKAVPIILQFRATPRDIPWVYRPRKDIIRKVGKVNMYSVAGTTTLNPIEDMN